MYAVETEQESDVRWIAEVPELPGVLAYGESREAAIRRAQVLSLHVLAERLEHGESLPQLAPIAKSTGLQLGDL
jgi:predicted RNase H-like HicB family nuclease